MGAYWWVGLWNGGKVDGWMGVGGARVGREGDTDEGERIAVGE